MKSLLEIRKIMKARKPTFLRTDSNKKKYKNKWRKPRGLQNKRRLQKAGHQKNPSQGFRSPKEVRGLHISGLELIKINNIKELQSVNSTKNIVELSATVGAKNKIQILEECKSKKIQVVNIKDIDKFIREYNEKLEARKKQRQSKIQIKKKSKAESIKKAEEKKKEGETEEKQEEIKEEVMHAKPKEVEPTKEAEPKRDSTKAKSGHFQSSIPGTRK